MSIFFYSFNSFPTTRDIHMIVYFRLLGLSKLEFCVFNRKLSIFFLHVVYNTSNIRYGVLGKSVMRDMSGLLFKAALMQGI